MCRDDGVLGWFVNLLALIFVGWTSHKQGYQKGQEDLLRQASILEMEKLREEVERLKKDRYGWTRQKF
jgi:hypothetical protein